MPMDICRVYAYLDVLGGHPRMRVNLDRQVRGEPAVAAPFAYGADQVRFG